MTKPGFFQRSELTQALWAFRREFMVVGVFSMVANVLMLSPTLYMLQVYDRVMVSQSELTLLVMSLITLFLFAVVAFSEWMRSRVLVRSGLRLDALQLTRATLDVPESDEPFKLPTWPELLPQIEADSLEMQAVLS